MIPILHAALALGCSVDAVRNRKDIRQDVQVYISKNGRRKSGYFCNADDIVRLTGVPVEDLIDPLFRISELKALIIEGDTTNNQLRTMLVDSAKSKHLALDEMHASKIALDLKKSSTEGMKHLYEIRLNTLKTERDAAEELASHNAKLFTMMGFICACLLTTFFIASVT